MRSRQVFRRLRVWLEQHEQPFVLAVTSAEPLWAVLDGYWGQPRADVIAAQIPAEAWQRLSAGEGAKGPRWYDWARVPLARLQLTAEERRWEHWLLVRRSRTDPSDLAYYVVFAPTGTALRTLALFALAYLAVLRAAASALGGAATTDVSPEPPPEGQQVSGRKGGPYQQPIDLSVELLPLSVPEVRHVLWALGQAASAEAAIHVVAWSDWRRRHQARARRCHYQRHLAHA